MERKMKENKKNVETVMKPVLVMVFCFAFVMVFLCLFIIWALPGIPKEILCNEEYQIRLFVENLDTFSNMSSGKTVIAKRKGELIAKSRG
jgi:hypothetical protein